MPPLPGPHHPPHGPHGHHGQHMHQCYVNIEGDLSRQQLAALLRRLSDELTRSSTVELGDYKISVPDKVWAIVRHDRGPRGDLIVKLEWKWFDGAGSVAPLPISSLLPADPA